MEKQTLTLAEELAAREWAVTVVIVNNQRQAYEPSRKLRVIDLNSPKILTSLPKLIRLLKQHRPKKLLSISGPLNILAITAKLLSGFPRKLFISERNHISSAAKYRVKTADQFRPILARTLYAIPNKILCVSEAVRQDLVKISGIPNDKAAILPNLFNLAEIQQSALAESGVRVPIPDGHNVIVTVGRLCRQKDQATLIKAFALLRAELPASLVIIGSGPLEPSLKNLAKNTPYAGDIHFTGFMANPYPLVARADVFVLPSLYEGLPGALIEALALGKTCVATNSPGGNSEVLCGGEVGYLCETADPASLMEAVDRALRVPIDPKACVARAEDFSIENNIAEAISVLYEIEDV